MMVSSSSSQKRGKSSWDDYATSLARRVGGHHHHHHKAHHHQRERRKRSGTRCFSSSSSSNANALGHAVFDEEENRVKVVGPGTSTQHEEEDNNKSNNNNNNNNEKKKKKVFTTGLSSSSSDSTALKMLSNNVDDETETSTQKGVGSVHLILGPMFAGKTTHLLDRVQRLEESSAAANVLLLKSDKDTRYARNKVVTHDGRGRECFPVTSLEVDVVVNAVGEKKWRECDVVAVDEAQFLTNLYEFCRVAADEHDKIVLVAGLNGDFKRETFGEVQETLPLCDSVTKLTAKCKCGRPALFSKRIVNAGDGQELVGGADKYLPACRRCFLN